MNHRVSKKLTDFQLANPTGAIIMINLVDPQVNTVNVFVQAVEDYGIPYKVVCNKADLVPVAIPPFKGTIVASTMTGQRMGEVLEATLALGERVVVLGVFNSGKSSLIAHLTGIDIPTGDLPGTTLSWIEYPFGDQTLIDTVGQVIDVNRPLMVSVDLEACVSIKEKVHAVMWADAYAILRSALLAFPDIVQAVHAIQHMSPGAKLVTIGAGASALVAMEIAGQALETGLPAVCITNNLAMAQPVSFAKGTAEQSGALARYITSIVGPDDILIGVSASGGTGFVYDAFRRCQNTKIAITENRDTPFGKAADIVIQSNAKPEGPSSSVIQCAHLAIGHALILALADERGVTANESIQYMMPERIATKKMGLK